MNTAGRHTDCSGHFYICSGATASNAQNSNSSGRRSYFGNTAAVGSPQHLYGGNGLSAQSILDRAPLRLFRRLCQALPSRGDTEEHTGGISGGCGTCIAYGMLRVCDAFSLCGDQAAGTSAFPQDLVLLSPHGLAFYLLSPMVADNFLLRDILIVALVILASMAVIAVRKETGKPGRLLICDAAVCAAITFGMMCHSGILFCTPPLLLMYLGLPCPLRRSLSMPQLSG